MFFPGVTKNKFHFASVLWPSTTIDYRFSEVYPSTELEKQLIIQTVDEFSKKTCVTFLFQPSNVYVGNTLRILNTAPCTSDFGYSLSDSLHYAQYIELDSSCLSKRTILFHFLRTLGVQNEKTVDDDSVNDDDDNSDGLTMDEVEAVNKLYNCSSQMSTTIPLTQTSPKTKQNVESVTQPLISKFNLLAFI